MINKLSRIILRYLSGPSGSINWPQELQQSFKSDLLQLLNNYALDKEKLESQFSNFIKRANSEIKKVNEEYNSRGLREKRRWFIELIRPTYAIFYKYLGDCGLRENDILGLTWDRIDLPNRFIRFTVQHRRTQKPKPAEVYIVDELFEFLTRHNNRLRKADEDNQVFQYNGKPIKIITRSVKTACKRADILYGEKAVGGFIFHDLRHTSITDMRRAGVDPLVNRKWHGHSLRGAHGGYHTIDQEDLKEAGQRLTEYRKNQSTKSSVDHTVDQVAKIETRELMKSSNNGRLDSINRVEATIKGSSGC